MSTQHARVVDRLVDDADAVRPSRHPGERFPIAKPRTKLTSAQPRHGTRATLIWLLLLISAYLGQTLPFLTRVPRVIMDESWEACTGYALATEGRLRNPVIQGRAGIDKAFVQPRVVQSLVLAGAYKLLGVSLASGRLASVLVGMGAVLGMYYLLRTWFSRRVSGLGALLLMLETRFFMAAHVVRPEAYMVCASVWMVALLMRGIERDRFLPCLAAGLVGGVGCYTHPNVALCVIVAVVMLLPQLGRGAQGFRLVGAYALGGVIAVVPFIAWVYYAHSHYGVSFVEQLGQFHTDVGAEPLAAAVRREVSRWANYLHVGRRGPLVLAMALGCVVAVFRGHRVQKWALAMILGHMAMMPVLIRHCSPMYLTVLSPWLATLVAVGAFRTWQYVDMRAKARRRLSASRMLVGTLMLLALANGAVANAYVINAYHGADYEAVCQRIASHIPLGSRVFGRLYLWTGLHGYPYLSDMNHESEYHCHTERAIVAHLVRFRPEYVVWSTDPCWSVNGVGPRNLDPNVTVVDGISTMRVYLDKVERERLRPRAIMLDDFETHDFGRITVYRLR